MIVLLSAYETYPYPYIHMLATLLPTVNLSGCRPDFANDR